MAVNHTTTVTPAAPISRALHGLVARRPGPPAVHGELENEIVVVQPIAAVPEREIRDRSLPEQAQDPIGVCRPGGRAPSGAEGEARRGAEHPGGRKHVVRTGRERAVPDPLAVPPDQALTHALPGPS